MTFLRTLALASVLAACAARPTMTQTQGRSYRAAFERQVASPQSHAQPPSGLDSQEAGIVAESYRKSLAPEGKETKEEPVLVITPQPKAGGPLAPSVPMGK
jgi:hypothetical protein